MPPSRTRPAAFVKALAASACAMTPAASAIPQERSASTPRQAAPTQQETDPTPEEIVVLGKLDIARVGFKLRKGRLTCKVTKGTGNRGIDAMACAAVENCYARSGALDRSTMGCIPEERRRLVRSYVARRAAS